MFLTNFQDKDYKVDFNAKLLMTRFVLTRDSFQADWLKVSCVKAKGVFLLS